MRSQLVIVALLLAASFSAHADEPARSKDAPAEKPAEKADKENPAKPDKDGWISLFDGKSLEGWKVPNFGGQGDVEVEDGTIVLGYGDGCTGVTCTRDLPKWNYEIALEAQRVDGGDFFCGLTFPVGEDPCSLIVGGWGGAVVGLSSIDGQDAANNETTRVMEFKNKRWYPIRVRVTKEAIQAWIEEEQVVDQPLKGHRISIRSEVELSRPLGIAAWNTTAALRKIKLRKLDDAPPAKK